MEKWSLIYWEEESRVSCIPTSAVSFLPDTAPAVGTVYSVKWGRKDLRGQLAGLGSKAAMQRLQEEFIVGDFDPEKGQRKKRPALKDVNGPAPRRQRKDKKKDTIGEILDLGKPSGVENCEGEEDEEALHVPSKHSGDEGEGGKHPTGHGDSFEIPDQLHRNLTVTPPQHESTAILLDACIGNGQSDDIGDLEKMSQKFKQQFEQVFTRLEALEKFVPQITTVYPPSSPLPTVAQSAYSPFAVQPLSSPFAVQPPSSPFADQTPSSPFADQTPSSPFADQTPSSPFADQAPYSSFAVQRPSSSPFAVQQPSSSQFAVQPPSSQFAVQPPSSQFAVQPPSSQFAVQPPSSQFAVQPPYTPLSGQRPYSRYRSAHSFPGQPSSGASPLSVPPPFNEDPVFF